MAIDISVSSESAKARALEALTRHGYQAASGPVMLAYPYAIQALDADEADHDTIMRLVVGVDPCAGRITVSPSPAATAAATSAPGRA